MQQATDTINGLHNVQQRTDASSVLKNYQAKFVSATSTAPRKARGKHTVNLLTNAERNDIWQVLLDAFPTNGMDNLRRCVG